MRRVAIIGGAALGAVVVPSLALATSRRPASRHRRPPAGHPATYTGTPPGTPPTCLAYSRSDPGYTAGFVPSATTPPGVYTTECTAASISYAPGTMTVVPYLNHGRRR